MSISNNTIDNLFLGEITSDFVIIADNIKEAAYQVKVKKFSDYPIFPISEEKISIGQPLYEKEVFNLKYNYNITYLDEFIQIGLISKEGKQIFINSYKDLNEFCCLFVVNPKFTKFLYIPYPED